MAGFVRWLVFLPCLDTSSVGSCLVPLVSTASRYVCVIAVFGHQVREKNNASFNVLSEMVACPCLALCLAVYGAGGDSGGVGCVLHFVCGGTGVLT